MLAESKNANPNEKGGEFERDGNMSNTDFQIHSESAEPKMQKKRTRESDSSVGTCIARIKLIGQSFFVFFFF